MLTPNSTTIEAPVLQELVQIADIGASKELGSSDFRATPVTAIVTMEACRRSCELLHSLGSFDFQCPNC